MGDLQRRVGSTIVGAAAVLGMAFAPGALAADDPPSGSVNHSGEHYTLDGSASTQAAATASPHVCSAAPTADGSVVCFSSVKGLNSESAAALRAGGLPPGYLGIPPSVTRETLAQRFDAAAQRGSRTPVGAQTAARRSKAGRRRVAHAADGSSCTGQSLTYIYTDANFGGTTGSQGWTGQNNWLNYSATYDNKVSSFWNSTTLFDSRWHDYANGGGAYYGNGFKCRYVNNLGNASMTDGGTANDRFSSFADW